MSAGAKSRAAWPRPGEGGAALGSVQAPRAGGGSGLPAASRSGPPPLLPAADTKWRRAAADILWSPRRTKEAGSRGGCTPKRQQGPSGPEAASRLRGGPGGPAGGEAQAGPFLEPSSCPSAQLPGALKTRHPLRGALGGAGTSAAEGGGTDASPISHSQGSDCWAGGTAGAPAPSGWKSPFAPDPQKVVLTDLRVEQPPARWPARLTLTPGMAQHTPPLWSRLAGPR